MCKNLDGGEKCVMMESEARRTLPLQKIPSRDGKFRSHAPWAAQHPDRECDRFLLEWRKAGAYAKLCDPCIPWNRLLPAYSNQRRCHAIEEFLQYAAACLPKTPPRNPMIQYLRQFFSLLPSLRQAVQNILRTPL